MHWFCGDTFGIDLHVHVTYYNTHSTRKQWNLVIELLCNKPYRRTEQSCTVRQIFDSATFNGICTSAAPGKGICIYYNMISSLELDV